MKDTTVQEKAIKHAVISAYYDGIRKAVEAFAVSKGNGLVVIGIHERPLAVVLEEINAQERADVERMMSQYEVSEAV